MTPASAFDWATRFRVFPISKNPLALAGKNRKLPIYHD
jgi:hypothetical protein